MFCNISNEFVTISWSVNNSPVVLRREGVNVSTAAFIKSPVGPTPATCRYECQAEDVTGLYLRESPSWLLIIITGLIPHNSELSFIICEEDMWFNMLHKCLVFILCTYRSSNFLTLAAICGGCRNLVRPGTKTRLAEDGIILFSLIL
jgi:hypothetical protein